MEKMAWGIDLGTTNSSIARLVNGRPTVVPVGGQLLVPSVVQYQDDRVIVGREARNTAVLYPERTVRSVKRAMGKPEAFFEVGGSRRTPQEVSAEILRCLAQGAEAETGRPVRELVITVPAYFDDRQRKATIEAAELAGLEVLSLLSEPTSAALVYEQVRASGSTEPRHLLVYDLGGGTFDVSVLEVFESAREVKATAGDTALGGDDFDRELMRLLSAPLTAVGAYVETDRPLLARLSRLAEEVKIALSREVVVDVREEIPAGGKLLPLELTITRRQFEALIEPMLERTVTLARQVVSDAGLKPESIDQICLVGGSTRIPRVRRLIEEVFTAPVHEEIDPDLCVALGACVRAAMLQGLDTDRILVDVTAHSLGIAVARTMDGYIDADLFAPIVRRNTVLPARHAEEFYTMVDNQKTVRVEVYQGESTRASQNTRVGAFELKLKPAANHSPIRVEFAYDLNGLVQVSASQAALGNEKSVALSLADASRQLAEAAPPAAVPHKPAKPNQVMARAKKLMQQDTTGARTAKLRDLVAKYDAAPDEPARAGVEQELLRAFVEMEVHAAVRR